MCAGKLLSLIKKCLHREKGGQKCDCGNSNNNSGGKTGQAKSSSVPSSASSSPSSTTASSSSTSSSSSSTSSASKKSPSPGQVPCGHCNCPMGHHYHQQQQQHHQQVPQCVPGTGDRAGYNKMCVGGSSPGYMDTCLPVRTDHPHAHGHSGTHCCGQPCNPVVYVPSSTAMDRMEREVALQMERQRRLQAIQTDTELNLPPAISISEDGEEGYAHSQRLLQLSCQQYKRSESIRPPPNKTVLCGESPPPYRSNSVSKIDGHYFGAKARGWGGPPQSYPPASCKHGSPYIARCHSVSSGEKRLASQHGQRVACSMDTHCGGTTHAMYTGSSHVTMANTVASGGGAGQTARTYNNTQSQQSVQHKATITTNQPAI